MNIRSIKSLKGILVGALLALRLSSAHADGPVILTQPANQSVLVGGAASFSVTVSNDHPISAENPGADDTVTATVVDASGHLYIGGNFTAVGGMSANHIAKWDGTHWAALGSGLDGNNNFNAEVFALAVSGNELYVAGRFATAGGVAANHIAKWDGTNWSAVGSDINGDVYALAVLGSDLYAGGTFTNAGGSVVNRIAKWNGSSWSALDSGVNGTVSALAVSGNDLYGAGFFTTAGGITANRIAKWNGSSWSAFGSGMNANVSALAVSGNDLYAAGPFSTAGGIATTNIAKWNGSNWSAVPSPNSSLNALWVRVNDVAVSGNDLYAAVDFEVSLGANTSAYGAGVVKWNGSSWSFLGLGLSGELWDGWDPFVTTLAVSGSDVYAGGAYRRAGDYPAYCIAKWNGDDWSALSENPATFTFQWQFNGANLTNGGGIGGAHLPTLVLNNVQVSQAGSYRVVVSSTNSTVLSSSALLSVDTNTLANALDTEGTAFVWSSSASPSSGRWFSQSAVTHDGVDAARSGPIGGIGDSSGLSTTVTGPGILTFWWKVSARPPYDGLHFSGGNQQVALLGEVDWQQQTVTIPSGTHALSWYYWHDGGSSGNPGQDCGWVDQVQFTPTCTVSIPSASQPHPASSSTGMISVAAAPDCSWTVYNPNSWISILSGTNATGNATVTYSVAANPTSSYRNGTIQIADKGFIVIQQNTPPPPCTFVLSPTNATPGFGTSWDVISVTTTSGCVWSVSNTNSWIYIQPSSLAPNSWSGGGMFSYTVSNNPSASPRSGNIRVAGQNFLVTQSGYNTNSITLAEALNVGGSPLVWTTGGDAPWFGQRAIAHDGVGAAESGAIGDSATSFLRTVVTGPGTLTFWWRVSSQANKDFLIFSVNGLEQARFSGVGFGYWQQRTVTLPAGTQTLEWQYAKDASTAAGDDRGWVDQVQFTPDSVPSCVISISPTNRVHPPETSSAHVDVNLEEGCFWGLSNTNPWITTVLGVGYPGFVDYTVAANPSPSSRTGMMMIGGNAYVVTQLGATNATCTSSVSPTNRTHGYVATTNTITINAAAGCPWVLINSNAWIWFPVTNGLGSAVLTYRVQANASSSPRSGSISVGNQLIFITQVGSTAGTNTNSCAITLLLTSRSYSSLAATDSVTVITGPGCNWSFSKTNSWLTFRSMTNDALTYVVASNATGFARTGNINIGGQLFTVTQAGYSPPLSAVPVLIPPIEVANIGHMFYSLNPLGATNGLPSGFLVQDFLVDQDHASDGGAELPNVSVNWDTNSQFTMTVSAPAGMRFVVEAPAGSQVGFAGYLWWESTRGGFSPPGTASVHFENLEGEAPEFSGTTPVLSDSHGFFGFADLEGTTVSNRFAFTSVTLTATLVPKFTGNGAEDYLPHPESAMLLSYSTTETNDPGNFVSIVPGGPLPLIRTITASPGSGVDLTIYGNAGQTHIVECSTDTVTWTQIASGVMPQSGAMKVRDVNVSKTSTTTSRFYRIVEVP